MRTLLVGDIHGCIDELHALLDAAGFDPDADALVSVGDLVGKGPDGAAVVRFFRTGGHRAVLGNHDDKLLRWRRARDAHETVRPLPLSHELHAEAMDDADWAWLAALPFAIDLPEHRAVVVHAGLVPGVPRDEQKPKHMMNLRSLKPHGKPSARVEDGEPWASVWTGPPHVYFGHDAVRGLQRWPHATGLDTGCVYGGQLSGAWLPGDELVQVPARRAYVPTR